MCRCRHSGCAATTPIEVRVVEDLSNDWGGGGALRNGCNTCQYVVYEEDPMSNDLCLCIYIPMSSVLCLRLYGRSRLIYILITAGLIYSVFLNLDVPATVPAHPSLVITNSYTGVDPTPSLRAFLLNGDNQRDDKEDLSTAADIALICTPAHSYTNRPILTHSCNPS